MLAHLAGWERVYATRLYSENNEKEAAGGSTVEFSDVYLQRGSAPPINISSGNGLSSSQPSLSLDGQRVVFIRNSRSHAAGTMVDFFGQYLSPIGLN